MKEMHALLRLGLISVLALSGACAGGGGDSDGSVDTCTTDLDCDDGHECTEDGCSVDNTCRHTPISERCEMGLTCEVGRGCVSSASCASDADCDDGIACTLDTCGVGGLCGHTALNERCSAPTTTCDTEMGCIVPPGCSSDSDCDDSVACTNDSCGVDRACTNTPLHELCDMAAMERCHETSGCFVPMPCDTAADCDDGDFCNGAEICDAEFGCTPADEPRVCDDSEDCTVDSCDGTVDMCVFACDSSRAECMCGGAPTCNGNFSLPGAMGNCLGAIGFNWDFTNVTFTNLGGAIEVTGWRVSTTAMVPRMADPGPACPSIDATTTLGAGPMGGCSETYRIMGNFTDDNTFVGTFSATFDSFCAGCTMSVPVTGTRL